MTGRWLATPAFVAAVLCVASASGHHSEAAEKCTDEHREGDILPAHAVRHAEDEAGHCQRRRASHQRQEIPEQ